MTATYELRRLLDERGVEWWEEDGHTLWYGESLYHAASAYSSFMFGDNERVHLNAMVTPQQAIDATLGRGTCEDEGDSDRFRCSACGLEMDVTDEDWEPTMWLDGLATVPRYCPNCGRQVVE